MPKSNEHMSPPVRGDRCIPPSVDRSLVDRVRKLMDKASATANIHEADAFSRKAAELIARHRIDPASLAQQRDDSLAVREIPLVSYSPPRRPARSPTSPGTAPIWSWWR